MIGFCVDRSAAVLLKNQSMRYLRHERYPLCEIDAVKVFENIFARFIIQGLVRFAALSSRGLGRGPLKAQTRVRIPLALLGPIVYRLGRHPFTVQRGVRFPLGLWLCDVAREIGGASVVRGRSSVWLEHSTVTREVAGSSPVGPVSSARSRRPAAGDLLC